jgi:hypothetical protein
MTTNLSALLPFVPVQDIPVGGKVGGLWGRVASKAPQLLEDKSQLLFLLMDQDEVLVQVRSKE